MLNRDVQYVVKVLSGANQGATAELPNHSGVVIGGSLGCDIIFSGVNVADRHVVVEVEGTKIRLTPLAQPVYIDGKDIGSHEILLRPNQLINIGAVNFTISSHNQPWPVIDPINKRLVTEADAPLNSKNGSVYRSEGVDNRNTAKSTILKQPLVLGGNGSHGAG